MAFKSSIIVVEDVLKSRSLYENIFKMNVDADFGIYNVSFEGGLSLYQKAMFQEISGTTSQMQKSNNFVLYFEVEALGDLEQELAAGGLEFIHSIREQPWRQRIFRCYDYDMHILEVAETMEAVSERLFGEGMTVEEITQATSLPVELVALHISELSKRNEAERFPEEAGSM